MSAHSTQAYGMADFHCDVLWKLLKHEDARFDSTVQGPLDVTLDRLVESNAILQTFAIFVPDRIPGQKPIWDSVDLFFRQVAAHPRMLHIRSAADVDEAMSSGRIGALLSLEGVDGLQGDFVMLRMLKRLGLRALGLTWNHANWAADGVMEPRGGGLTDKGRRLVEECEQLGIILDVSHLSERGFWELADTAERPFIASHSNAKSLCPHPRNLTDDQIKALIAIDGRIGITYVPYFVKESGAATIDDVVRHIDHIASLGGEEHLMLGSDFDGIDKYVERLQSPKDVSRLTEALLRAFPERTVRNITSGNAIRFLKAQLPQIE